MPDATRPLLRQLEAMQAAASSQQDAWAAAEQSLSARIAAAEGRAAAAPVGLQGSASRHPLPVLCCGHRGRLTHRHSWC